MLNLYGSAAGVVMSLEDRMSLQGRVALVTGASGGLGRHFAGVLAAAGATVVVAARRADKVAAVVAEITDAGGRAVAVSADVTDGESIDAAFTAAEREAGVVTVLVNNAGVAETKSALDLSEADWRRVIDTNLTGSWAVASEAARRMVAGGVGGSIVNIASMLGLGVSKGVLPYAVSKAGVVQMTKAMALEWARYDIRVNALAPGYIETDINRDYLQSDAGREMMRRIPQRRIGRLEDLDGPLMLLAGDASAYMTGVVIPVDGGQLVGGL